MARVTKKGGYLAVTVPNLLNLYVYLNHQKLMKSGKSDFGYEYFYTPWELRKLFKKCGLKPLYFTSELRLVGGYHPLIEFN